MTIMYFQYQKFVKCNIKHQLNIIIIVYINIIIIYVFICIINLYYNIGNIDIVAWVKYKL